ncbi:hypothetical protein EMGBD1_11320, partial [Anaerolineaceae bacterium]
GVGLRGGPVLPVRIKAGLLQIQPLIGESRTDRALSIL